MLGMVIGDVHTPPEAVSYYASPVDAMFDVIGNLWSGVPTVLNGDNTAKAASGGSFNTLYYQTLWQETQPLTEQQLNEAARITASYAYTAWVNAGQPLVPGSTGVETGAGALATLELSPNPARGAIRMSYRAPQTPTIEVFDARGARVAKVSAGAPSGDLSWTPGSRMAPGLYFIQLTAPGGVRVVRRVAVVP